MKLSRKLLLVLLFAALTPISASAAIVSFDPFTGGNGSIVPGGCGPFNCFFDKFYDAVGPMSISFDVDSGGDYQIDEAIFNNTGLGWSDFHWSLSEEFGNVTISSVVNFAPFTAISGLGTTMVDIDGGLLADGGVFTPSIVLNVGNAGGGLFTLTQVPTLPSTAPEPASLALLAFGLGLLRRNR